MTDNFKEKKIPPVTSEVENPNEQKPNGEKETMGTHLPLAGPKPSFGGVVSTMFSGSR